MSNLFRQLPPLGTLVVFEAAFRLGSFSRAADEVALSQASVSRQIRQLEENLGVSLFIRHRHNVTPTDEGRVLGSTVRLTLRELLATAEKLRSIGVGQNSFTIFSDISIANTLITPVISLFQQQFQDLQLRVLSSATELAKLPLLHLEDIRNDWPNWSNFLASFQGPPPVGGVVFNSYQVCLDVAERGEGVALGWARSVKTKIEQKKLVRLSAMTMQLPESIFVYRRKLSSPNPIAEQFIHTLRMHIEPLSELLD